MDPYTDHIHAGMEIAPVQAPVSGQMLLIALNPTPITKTSWIIRARRK
jgi:hypothetical protein